MSPDAAALFAEMHRAGTTGLRKPCGDRTVHGKTAIDEVLPSLLAAR